MRSTDTQATARQTLIAKAEQLEEMGDTFAAQGDEATADRLYEEADGIYGQADAIPHGTCTCS